MAPLPMARWPGEDAAGAGGECAASLRRGQCWQVLIGPGRIDAAVKLLHVGRRTVVLRALENVDLTARYDLGQVEFLRRIDG